MKLRKEKAVGDNTLFHPFHATQKFISSERVLKMNLYFHSVPGRFETECDINPGTARDCWRALMQ